MTNEFEVNITIESSKRMKVSAEADFTMHLLVKTLLSIGEWRPLMITHENYYALQATALTGYRRPKPKKNYKK